MINDKFAKKLFEHRDKYEKDTFAHVVEIDLEKIKAALSSDLGISNLKTIIPLFGKKVLLDDELTDLIQTTHLQDEVVFSVFGVVSRDAFYLLVVAPIKFFSTKTESNAYNPYQESEDFDKFAAKLKKYLNLDHVELYESEDGFYHAKIKMRTRIYSFFLYKV